VIYLPAGGSPAGGRPPVPVPLLLLLLLIMRPSPWLPAPGRPAGNNTTAPDGTHPLTHMRHLPRHMPGIDNKRPGFSSLNEAWHHKHIAWQAPLSKSHTRRLMRDPLAQPGGLPT
jgi:hypothetical protein